MRFLRDTIIVSRGDTVEWTSLDPSINHTVTFGVEPAGPRPPSEARNGNYSVAHANFVVAYTRDNLAHVIYPGGVSKDDCTRPAPFD